MDRSTTTLFATHANPFCHSATGEQDDESNQVAKLCVEGKITQSWGMLQLGHYQEQHSRQMVDKWMLGLVTQLLELTQGMWKHCNGVLHVVDEQGLPLKQAAELEADIHEEFIGRTPKDFPERIIISFDRDGMMLCQCQ
jgi:hypothetical protein